MRRLGTGLCSFFRSLIVSGSSTGAGNALLSKTGRATLFPFFKIRYAANKVTESSGLNYAEVS